MEEVKKFNQKQTSKPDEEFEATINTIENDKKSVEDAYTKHIEKEKAKFREAGLPEPDDGDNPDPKTMFDAISDTIIKVFSDPEIANSFHSIREKLETLSTVAVTDRGCEPLGAQYIENVLKISRTDDAYPANIAKEIIGLVSTSVTYSIFAAIGYYDDFLKKSLERDFEQIASIMHEHGCQIEATKMFHEDVRVLKKKVLEMEKSLLEKEASKKVE